MSTRYCFTWNNYKEEDINFIKSYKSDYLIFGEEIGESGTPHLQGYIEFAGTKKLETLHKHMPKVHWEPRRGTQEQAITYCKKDGKFHEQGEKKTQGERTDLNKIGEMILNKTFVPSEHPTEMIRYHKGIQAFTEATYKDRTEPPTVKWLWGKSKTNKSRTAWEAFGPADSYPKDCSRWWNGYSQQSCIIIDDFDGWWDYRDLLRLLDRYPYSGQTKGGYVKINSPMIYITCEFPPEHFWKNENELKQVTRRLSDIQEMKNTNLLTCTAIH